MSQWRLLPAALLLVILRITLAAWIGAAALFVITSVAEQTSPEFDSVVRDQLATVRFPLYYGFGFAVHAIAAATAGLALVAGPRAVRRRLGIVLGLVALSAVLVCLDYFWIYAPLQDLIIPPGRTRTQDFVRLHTWSRQANEVHLTVALLATVVASWPFRRDQSG